MTTHRWISNVLRSHTQLGVYSDPHRTELIQFMKDDKVKVIIVAMLAQALP